MEHYDNEYEISGSENEFVKVDRVYSFNFSKFNKENWSDLSSLYKLLPKYIENEELGIPYWFGSDEEQPPYLWASVEPSGLQVHGVLSAEDLEIWHRQLLSTSRQYVFPLNKF